MRVIQPSTSGFWLMIRLLMSFWPGITWNGPTL